MPAKIRAENNRIQFFTKGVSELRIPSVEKKFLCRSCWRQFQNPLFKKIATSFSINKGIL
jgi:hypothetical protein